MNIVPCPAALAPQLPAARGRLPCLLPLLEAMRPASPRGGGGGYAPVTIQTNQGSCRTSLLPEKAGRDYELALPENAGAAPPEFTVFSGLSHPGVDGGHANEVSFLPAPHPAGAAFRNSISLDQLAAERIGNETHYASLVVAASNAGDRSMSFNRSGVLIPPGVELRGSTARRSSRGRPKEIEGAPEGPPAPVAACSTPCAERAKRSEQSVNASDQSRLDQYFTSIRELEGQLLQAESSGAETEAEGRDAGAEGEMKDSAMLITRLRDDVRHHQACAGERFDARRQHLHPAARR